MRIRIAIWIIVRIPARRAVSWPNPAPCLSSPPAFCRGWTPAPQRTPSERQQTRPTTPGMPAATASSAACSPCVAPWWCSAVHAVAPSRPPPPRPAQAAGFAAGSLFSTLPIADSVVINRRESLSSHGTCFTVLLAAAFSHALLPKAHSHSRRSARSVSICG